MSQVTDELRLVKVAAMREVAADIVQFDLCAADGRPLAPFAAGAHIDVHTPSGLVRQYSLCGLPGETAQYSIAVKHERGGRGGSASLHGNVEVGSALGISPPRNHFPLADDALHTILVAGGIGITPILAMIATLEQAGKSWELHYCARSERHAAYHAQLRERHPGKITEYFSEEPIFPIQDVVGKMAASWLNIHLYCCGPAGLMHAVQASTPEAASQRVHFEWFAAPQDDGKPNEPFEIEIASSGKVFPVSAEETALEVLRAHGIDIGSSCEEGVCGTCEVHVLSGCIEHRDVLLSEAERAGNKCMMTCVSRGRRERIVLDL
ncbi:PDR/VanB family oxidoreductase [Cupriavidus oxalaticus]|uniref:Oxidoreductase n=1 Tax=Cupriavidus oxalaticus TaxID=96344 RepID=A0A375GD00_9BURK|nr:PDR/VanB family oxidoreductase [Cupriavidus oxalaticus]QRQ86359.1 oxidoreductase [Cupriavidus oxalaticus]QRQ95314.1 oxidoreductase [Cupriavidus oxalaticus]WQD83968.1 PDR/VanB family oxidoreductase [Cupriavidus oxalaticus]SPC17270.1 Phenoxybenzoate dioxygenase subunit beta [Cupriavidus oxalaticus]